MLKIKVICWLAFIADPWAGDLLLKKFYATVSQSLFLPLVFSSLELRLQASSFLGNQELQLQARRLAGAKVLSKFQQFLFITVWLSFELLFFIIFLQGVLNTCLRNKRIKIDGRFEGPAEPMGHGRKIQGPFLEHVHSINATWDCH